MTRCSINFSKQIKKNLYNEYENVFLIHHANTFSQTFGETNAGGLCGSNHSTLHIHTHRQWLLHGNTKADSVVCGTPGVEIHLHK